MLQASELRRMVNQMRDIILRCRLVDAFVGNPFIVILPPLSP